MLGSNEVGHFASESMSLGPSAHSLGGNFTAFVYDVVDVGA